MSRSGPIRASRCGLASGSSIAAGDDSVFDSRADHSVALTMQGGIVMGLRNIALVACIAGAAAGCRTGDDPGTVAGEAPPATARLQEVWQTERDTLDNIDSPA